MKYKKKRKRYNALKYGTKHEYKEHKWLGRKKAKRVAYDHLKKHRNYYLVLKRCQL